MLNQLPKIVTKSKKRIGRGIGSGKGGHTSSRGQKGQKTRDKIHPLFEGTKVKKSLIQRLPLQRGKGKLKPKAKPLFLKLDRLNRLRAGSLVDVNVLVKEGIVPQEALRRGVKILDGGILTKKLKVKLPITEGASKKIAKAGGEVVAL